VTAAGTEVLAVDRNEVIPFDPDTLAENVHRPLSFIPAGTRTSFRGSPSGAVGLVWTTDDLWVVDLPGFNLHAGAPCLNVQVRTETYLGSARRAGSMTFSFDSGEHYAYATSDVNQAGTFSVLRVKLDSPVVCDLLPASDNSVRVGEVAVLDS